MNYDTIIVGAGTMGMATSYYLAKKGQKVLLLDAYNPPHDKGSHHGETRIIRYAYGEGMAYVPLALRARKLWKYLEESTNKNLLIESGVLNIGPKDYPFIKNVIKSAADYGLDLFVMTPDEIHHKWPGIKIPPNFIGCFEPQAGVLRAEECIQAYKQLALNKGVTLKTEARVTKIEPGEKVLVHTAEGSYCANSVIITAGARVNDLLTPLNLTLPITSLRKTFAWFDANENLYGDGFPAFTYEDEQCCYYGFPSIDGAGFKIGRHDLGETVHPDDFIRSFDEKDSQELIQFNEKVMREVGKLKEGKTCFYARTPDEDFIIDHHPEYDNILIAAGFSGHGFKFASAIGEVLSQLTLKEVVPFDLSPFEIARFKG